MKKILLSSDCNGNLQTLFQKVNQLNQKNKFDLMFLTGNVLTFQSSQYIKLLRQGSIKIQIPTFFINNSPLSKILNLTYPEGFQIAPNFHFLGAKGLKNIMGLNVCFINGISKKVKTQQAHLTFYKGQYFDQNDVDQLLKLCQQKYVDILLTNEWPLQINNQIELNPLKSQLVSRLTQYTCPKYHLTASGNKFFRLSPYKNNKQTYSHFINVAQMKQNNLKDKYLLAIQTIPYSQSQHLSQSIDNCIESPFKNRNVNLKESQNKNKIEEKKIDKIKNNSIYQKFGQIYNQRNQEHQKDKMSQGLQSKQNKKMNNHINENTYVYFDGFPSQAQNIDIQQFLQRWGSIIKLQVYKQLKGNYSSGIVKFSNLTETTNCLNDSGKFALYQNRIKFKSRTIQQKYHNEDCWFCDKNQKFDKELLVFRSTYCSICLDKGPVSAFHLQIIPINHVHSTGNLQNLQLQEIEFIKKQLKRQFRQNGFEVIVYQRYIRLSEQINHCIIHFIPLETKNLVNKFNDINSKNRCGFKKVQSQKRKNEYFIKLQIQNCQYIKEIHQKEKVEGDYMRKIICEMIDKPQLINWRDCQVSSMQIEKRKQVVANILKRCHIQTDII